MGILDALSRLFGASPQEAQPLRTSSADPHLLEVLHNARSAYEANRWRAALAELESAGKRMFDHAGLLALWMRTKKDLSEPHQSGSLFRQLLRFSDVDPAEVARVYIGLVESERIQCGPLLIEWVDEVGLDSEQAEVALRFLHEALWEPDRLFDALSQPADPRRYDQLLAIAKTKFRKHPRYADVPPRPYTRAERMAQEAQQRQASREAAIAKSHANRKWYEGLRRRNEELEDAILADRDAVEPYLIYGDWLQQRGDPRGELIAVQVRCEQNPADDTARAEERRLLTKLEPGLLGSVVLEEKPLTGGFRRGFLERARIAATAYDEIDGAETRLAELCEKPDARFVRELTIGGIAWASGEELWYADLIKQLAELSGKLPSVRSLFLGDFDSMFCEISWSAMGSTVPLYKAFPKLERLKLRAGSFMLGKLAHDSLTHFSLETGGLQVETLTEVTAAHWPRLQSLSLWFGDPDYGCTTTPDDLEPLLRGENLGNLTHLGLGNAVFADEMIEMLALSKILPRLETLDLSLGCLTDDGAESLLEEREHFAHLKRLDLRQNCLDGTIDRLGTVCNEVLHENQDLDRLDGDYRYAAVGE